MIYINNNFMPSDTPCIYANERGLLLADGLFETLSSISGHLLFYREHFRRLVNSAKYLKILFDYTSKQLFEICKELIIRNDLHNENAYLRITLTRGRGDRGISISRKLTNTLLITTGKNKLADEQKPITLNLSKIIRNEKSILTTLKTTQYLDHVLTREQASEEGFDDGLMLNTKGCITETSAANIFFVRDNCVFTPRITDGVLKGITRHIILKLCKKNGIPVKEQSINMKMLETFNNAFISNTLIGLQPVRSIDNKVFNVDQNYLFKKILNLYNNECQKT